MFAKIDDIYDTEISNSYVRHVFTYDRLVCLSVSIDKLIPRRKMSDKQITMIPWLSRIIGTKYCLSDTYDYTNI